MTASPPHPSHPQSHSPTVPQADLTIAKTMITRMEQYTVKTMITCMKQNTVKNHQFSA